MKIYSALDLPQIDQYTVEQEGITSLELMERAASALYYEIVPLMVNYKSICIFAGPGNNGGDALALARMLLAAGCHPQIFLFNTATQLTPDCEANKVRLLEEYPDAAFNEVVKTFVPPTLTSDTIVVDGLFGSGLNRPLVGGYTSLVEYINESGAYIVSIDIPSGLMCDWEQRSQLRYIVKANITYTFQYPKLSFFFGENEPYVGEWKVLDIGLKAEPQQENFVRMHCIECKDVAQLLRKRDKFSSKGDYGHGLLVGGRYGMMGAMQIAAKAAMHSGVGLTTVHSPRCGYMIMQSSLPEVIFDPDADDLVCTEITLSDRYNAIGIGPGMGRGSKETGFLRSFVSSRIQLPIVLDADALNIISRHKELLGLLPANAIITPHVGEFERLYDCVIDSDAHRVQQAVAMAAQYNIIVVLKGAHTAIVTPQGDIYFNNTGNSGMATAGSGDALTGIITSLLAQNYSPLHAAIVGVHLHGLAGDIAAAESGEEYVTASDIIASLGKAFKKVHSCDK